MKKFILLMTTVLFLGSVFADARVDGPKLTGEQIKTLINHKMVSFTHNKDRLFSASVYHASYNAFVTFFPDGTTAGMITVPLAGIPNKDTGRWWMKDDQQCAQWTHWFDNKPFCTSWYEMKTTYIVFFDSGNSLSAIVSKDKII